MTLCDMLHRTGRLQVTCLCDVNVYSIYHLYEIKSNELKPAGRGLGGDQPPAGEQAAGGGQDGAGRPAPHILRTGAQGRRVIPPVVVCILDVIT